MDKPTTISPFFPNRGAQMLSAIMLRGWSGPSRGSQLLQAKASSAREVAERLGCGKTYAHYLMTGERSPTVERTAELAEAYGVPEWTWCELPYVRDPLTKGWVSTEPIVDEDDA
jgi:transcriptional regulator with XRE-family HTH domain